MIRLPALLLPPASALLLIATAPAQDPLSPLLHMNDWTLPWTGAFHGGAAGDFMGERMPSVVALRGQRLVFQPFAAVFEAHVTVNAFANDVATCSNAGAPAGTDAAVFVGPGGLYASWLDSSGAPPTLVTLDSSPEFADARTVRCGDVDGDSFEDIVVVSADDVTIRVKLGTAGGQFVDGPVMTSPEPVHHLELVQWFTGQPEDLAIVTTQGLRVVDGMDPGFEVYLSVPSRQSGYDAIAVVPPADPRLPEGVAWVTAQNTTGPGQHLLYFDSLLPGPQVVLRLTNDVTGISSADLDGDGDGDLVSVGSDDTVLLVRWNQTLQPTPGAQEMFEESYRTDIALGPAGRPNPGCGRPLLVDLDLDGVIDFLVHSDVDDGSWIGDGGSHGFASDSGFDVSFTEDFFCAQPSTLRMVLHGVLDPQWNVIEVGIYRSPGYGQDFDPVPMRFCRQGAAHGVPFQRVEVKLADGKTWEEWIDNPEIYVGFVRPAQYDGQTVVESGPIFAYTFSSNHGVVPSYGWPEATMQLIPISLCEGTGGGGDCIGIIRSVPSAHLPPELPPNTAETSCSSGL